MLQSKESIAATMQTVQAVAHVVAVHSVDVVALVLDVMTAIVAPTLGR